MHYFLFIGEDVFQIPDLVGEDLTISSLPASRATCLAVSFLDSESDKTSSAPRYYKMFKYFCR